MVVLAGSFSEKTGTADGGGLRPSPCRIKQMQRTSRPAAPAFNHLNYVTFSLNCTVKLGISEDLSNKTQIFLKNYLEKFVNTEIVCNFAPTKQSGIIIAVRHSDAGLRSW
jgi:hypothetical protein